VTRYIIRYSGPGQPDVVRAAARVTAGGGRVVDTSTSMVLFDAGSSAAQALAAELVDWTLAPETLQRVPQPKRPRPRS
jgi:hypothetical protein